MENATTRQLSDGIRFDVGGYQLLYVNKTKNYKVNFKVSGGFRFVYRYLDTDNHLSVRYDGSSLYFEETRQGEERLILQHEVAGTDADTWTMRSNEGYVFATRAGMTATLPYMYIMEGGLGIEAETGIEVTGLEMFESVPDFNFSGEGSAYAEAEGVVLVGGRSLGGVNTLTGTHTFSVEFEGDGVMRFGGEEKVLSGKGIERLTVDCVGETTWSVASTGELFVEGVQVEVGAHGNIILGAGETLAPSELSFPVKNNLYGQASILLEGERQGTDRMELFRSGNVVIELNAGLVQLRVGTAVATTTAVTGKMFTVKAAYDENGLSLAWTSENEDVIASYTGEVEPILGTEMWLTSEAYPFMGALSRLVIWKRRLDLSTLTPASEPLAKSFESDFDDAISSKEKSFVEGTLAPVDGSPLLVEDESGALNRVNFFDFENAEYRTYNEEFLVYDGESDFVIVSYDGLDEANFKVQVYDDDVLVGEAQSVSGRKVPLTLTDEEKRRLLGKELMVRYQVERSYVVDYQRAALDSYRIYLTKHQGLELSVTQEGNRNGRYRLSKEIELNPMQNVQSEGFLYISDKEQTVRGMRVFVTPSSIVADGTSTATVVVEPIDEEGNEVVGASLLLKTTQGVIEPIISERQAKARVTGGRYMYVYHAPYYKDEAKGFLRFADIEVLDRKSGIGQKVRVPLKPTTRDGRATATFVEEGAQIVFEYMSKCFKRLDAPEEWVGILDQNGDGRIDEEEIEWLRQNKGRQVVRQMASKLQESEGAQ